MTLERILNNYYNIGGFNKPERIGYMMNMIRKLKPLTEEEWQIWYLTNVHNEDYLDDLANQMCMTIPPHYQISKEDCKNYIYDVMFRRTFNGFNKENQALKILRETISNSIQESPAEWDTEYFIDFYVNTKNNGLIGIQLKPETFYLGYYQSVVDINGKMEAFRQKYQAHVYILKYKPNQNQQSICFSNPEIIDEIKSLIE